MTLIDRIAAGTAGNEEVAACGCLRCTKERCETNPGETVFGQPVALMRMFTCNVCGNKRCPHSDDHRNACTNSNRLGQVGSRYADALISAVQP